MTREQKKSILQDYPYQQIRIQNLKDQYTELFTVATHITTSYEGTGSTTHNNDSKVEKRCIKLAELSMKIGKAQRRLDRIDSALKELRPYYRFLIEEIDIKGKGVYRVARQAHRDPSSIARTHNKALDALNL